MPVRPCTISVVRFETGRNDDASPLSSRGITATLSASRLQRRARPMVIGVRSTIVVSRLSNAVTTADSSQIEAKETEPRRAATHETNASNAPRRSRSAAYSTPRHRNASAGAVSTRSWTTLTPGILSRSVTEPRRNVISNPLGQQPRSSVDGLRRWGGGADPTT
jgi:hypothetical protein